MLRLHETLHRKRKTPSVFKRREPEAMKAAATDPHFGNPAGGNLEPHAPPRDRHEMTMFTPEQIKRVDRLKQMVDFARFDLEARRGRGWSDQARAEAVTHLRHCQDLHRAFLASVAADSEADWPPQS